MFSEVWASRGRKPVGVQKNAPFSTEKNEPRTKVLSLKTKKFSSNYVFRPLGHSGQFRWDKKWIFKHFGKYKLKIWPHIINQLEKLVIGFFWYTILSQFFKKSIFWLFSAKIPGLFRPEHKNIRTFLFLKIEPSLAAQNSQ